MRHLLKARLNRLAHRSLKWLLIPLLAGMAACGKQAPTSSTQSGISMSANPPVAALRPYQVESPSGARNDNYYWLRDDERKNKDMLDYLAAENAYTDAALAPV